MIACLSTNGPSVCHLAAPPTRLLVATLTGLDIIEREKPGAPWIRKSHVLDGQHVSALMMPPGGNGIFASIHNGKILHSSDGGQTWATRDTGVSAQHIFSLGFCEHAGGVTLYAGSEPVSLFRSNNNGATWEELPAIQNVPGHETWTFPPPPHLAHTKSYLFDSQNPDVFYVAIEQGALLKTTDGGKSWRELDGFFRPDDVWPKDVHRVVRDPKNPERIFLVTGTGLYRSDDSGENWTHVTTMSFRIGYPDQLIFSPQNPNTFFMSGAERDPRTWRQSHEAHGTVLRSSDDGATWQEANNGLPNTGRANIEAMNAAVYPGGFTLFAGNTDGEIYASDDSGANWIRIVSGLKPVSKGGHFRNLQDAPAAA